MTQPPKKPRRHNPAWHDTREQKAARARKRQAALKQFALANGFSSVASMQTALLNGNARIVKA